MLFSWVTAGANLKLDRLDIIPPVLLFLFNSADVITTHIGLGMGAYETRVLGGSMFQYLISFSFLLMLYVIPRFSERQSKVFSIIRLAYPLIFLGSIVNNVMIITTH
jgi:hypothetical protein